MIPLLNDDKKFDISETVIALYPNTDIFYPATVTSKTYDNEKK